MKKILKLMAVATLIMGFTACSEQDMLATDVTGGDNAELLLNGNCDIYTLPNAENTDWTITNCPEWATPVKKSGSADADIQIYVESSSLNPLRQGSIDIAYANGVTRSTRIMQTNEASEVYLQRSYAAGWSFDIRTYNDIRGVRQQIFNTQKLKDDPNAYYAIMPNPVIDYQLYYGKDVSNLQSDITAKLNIDTNYNAFSLNLNGSFGRHTLSNSSRVFSWLRYILADKEISINVDAEDAVNDSLFTVEFAAMRQEVIDANGSDASIARLIEMYGTHYVGSATLGGCLDYYYSTVLSESVGQDTIEGAVKLSFEKKFKVDISGDASYQNSLSSVSSETMERYEIKGGDAAMLARAIEDGSISQEAINAWSATVDDILDENDHVTTPGKHELVGFNLEPIQVLFPTEICNKITDYLNRIYYSELPLTRSKN